METGRHTSELLAALQQGLAEHELIRVEDMVKMLGERVFGLSILLFCIPNCLPIPNITGLSAITGIPIIVMGAQMMLGRSQLWLPKRLLHKQFSGKRLGAVLQKAMPYIHRMEKWWHPRLGVMTSGVAQPLLGLAFVVLATLMSLPIPFGNFLPGFAIALMAIGLIERDGVLVLLGLLVGVAMLMFLATIADTLAAWASGWL